MTRQAAVFFVLIFASSGCASIFNSAHQSIYVDSDPKGADVKSNKLHRAATTPTAFDFDKGNGEELTITISKPGYVDQTMDVHRKVTPSFWANFLWLGFFPIGMAVDAVTGEMWNFDQTVFMKLEPESANVGAPQN